MSDDHVPPETMKLPADRRAEAHKIIAQLADYHADAWRTAPWEGEYWELPDLDQPGTLQAVELGLIDPADGGSMTQKGEDVVVALIERSGK